MTTLVAIRPQPGCEATVAAARARGLDARAFPLFVIEPRDWATPDPATFDALLLGSANAVRHAGPALAAYAGKPAYAVGAETARAAQAAGLTVIATGSGGLQDVLARIAPPHARLLRLAGETRVALESPPQVTITERVVYASVAQPMPAELVALLRHPVMVLLHSAEAARHFSSECDRLGLGRSHLALAALGPRIAMAVGDGWRALEIAESPNDAALLAIAAKMCQTVSGLRGTAKKL